jgi:hypothetical protein
VRVYIVSLTSEGNDYAIKETRGYMRYIYFLISMFFNGYTGEELKLAEG